MKYLYTLRIAAFLFIGNILAHTAARAQDSTNSMLGMLAQDEKPAPEIVIATFKDSRIVNFHTIETAGRRSLDYRISHRFGPVNGGAYEFFGLDGGASIRMALEYSPDGRIQLGLGRTNIDKTLDGYAKYRLLRQKTQGMPLSVTLLSGISLTTLRDVPVAGGFTRYERFSSRLSYVHQIMIARKFSEKLSLQLSPTMVHLNWVKGLQDKNDIYSLIALGRMKMTRRMALTAEYGLRLTQNYSKDGPYYNSLAFGWEIETGGHVFQIHAGNSQPMLETQALPFSRSSWGKGDIRIGFNISRVFTL